MGAVVLGTPDNGQLRWVGCAGSGFKAKAVQDLYATLLRLRTDVSPFPNGTKVPKLASWVKPVLICGVKYYDTTKNGQLIWPIFKGCVTEVPDSGSLDPNILAKYREQFFPGEE